MLITVREAAIEFTISEQTIRRLIRAGKIPVVRFGPKSTRIDLEQARAAFAERGSLRPEGEDNA